MRSFDQQWNIPGMANWLKRQAYMGIMDMNRRPSPGDRFRSHLYMERCKGFHIPTGTLILLTRDTGHHTCGWWKNPDYERCLHLSLSFTDPETGHMRDHDHDLAGQWVHEVFRDSSRLVWAEPPYSPEGKARDVWHYRVFYADASFRAPILPRGEVYTKEFTEAGWKSWSDVQEERRKQAAVSEPQSWQV
jgi:hypothetical protein